MSWALLKESSPRGERLRRRAAALGGATVFAVGLLIAAGLALLLLFLLVAFLVAGAIGMAVWFVQRDGLARVRKPDWSGWPYAGAKPAELAEPEAAEEQPSSEHGVRRRRALRLNARGAVLRGEGRALEAADQHRQALEVFRSLGDRQAEAPTLNSLALALDAAGETEAAIERFEEALAILRELDDERHEGKVIANLGFTMLRHGEDDQAQALLETALAKLDPESSAARQVVMQLRRAS